MHKSEHLIDKIIYKIIYRAAVWWWAGFNVLLFIDTLADGGYIVYVPTFFSKGVMAFTAIVGLSLAWYFLEDEEEK